jgi:predicted aspartyl protease
MASSRPILFPYEILHGRWSPMISAGICLHSHWKSIHLFVDSGATYTILRPKLAEELGFDWRKGRKVMVQVGDGSLIPVYLHQLPIQIGGTRFEAAIGFSSKLGVRFHLLGRLGVFDHFKICFHDRQRVVSFLPCV